MHSNRYREEIPFLETQQLLAEHKPSQLGLQRGSSEEHLNTHLKHPPTRSVMALRNQLEKGMGQAGLSSYSCRCPPPAAR